MVDLASRPYLRFPHVRGNLVTFVADDDVWLVPLAGGRAWRLTAESRDGVDALADKGSGGRWTAVERADGRGLDVRAKLPGS